MRRGGDARLAGPLWVSAALHLAILGAVLWAFRATPPIALPPIYKVDIVAAPPGPRSIGQVSSRPAPETPTPTPTKMRETPKPEPSVPVKNAPAPTPRATPVEGKAKTEPTKNAPVAHGGPTGGKGTDVATVQTGGIDFPFPGYLNNIVRQIAVNFRPRNNNAALSATVRFLIHRDGHVSDITFVTRSGVYAFDLEAQGAVERAANDFGPLPAGFHDDVLPVVFSFDPKFLR
jgi:protein TonB